MDNRRKFEAEKWIIFKALMIIFYDFLCEIKEVCYMKICEMLKKVYELVKAYEEELDGGVKEIEVQNDAPKYPDNIDPKKVGPALIDLLPMFVWCEKINIFLFNPDGPESAFEGNVFDVPYTFIVGNARLYCKGAGTAEDGAIWLDGDKLCLQIIMDEEYM